MFKSMNTYQFRLEGDFDIESGVNNQTIDEFKKYALHNNIDDRIISYLNFRPKHLHKIDEVAYIRFASVYRSFDDLSEFLDELNKLVKKD